MNHVVLYQPEIPQNTGNIMRTCVAVKAKLHLIEPLGFSLDEKYIKRSAANYLEHLDYEVYPNIEAFFEKNKGEYYFLTRYGHQAPSAFNYQEVEVERYFIFGSESSGMPKELLENHLDRCFRLPMSGHIRSMNLSNVVAIIMYEVMRQQDYHGLETFEPEHFKGKDYLKSK